MSARRSPRFGPITASPPADAVGPTRAGDAGEQNLRRRCAAFAVVRGDGQASDETLGVFARTAAGSGQIHEGCQVTLGHVAALREHHSEGLVRVLDPHGPVGVLPRSLRQVTETASIRSSLPGKRRYSVVGPTPAR